MEKEVWFFIIGAVIVAAGVIYALCWNAGDLTRQEEEENAE